MAVESFVPPIVEGTRILSHGKITSLANGFHLPQNRRFTIYARPKENVELETPDIVISVKCYRDSKPSDIPITLNEWQPLYLESIAPDNEILNSVDLYWGCANV